MIFGPSPKAETVPDIFMKIKKKDSIILYRKL
jgi:hypothetical protein